MIYITGDIHGNYDIHKLKSKNFSEGKDLTRDDYLIICGDFGLIWENSEEELYWRDWLENKPWTTLWIDGNHENFDLLEEYPEEEWHGGMIQKISDHVYHLCRGYVFEIDGLKVFAFGGAESHDKEYRRYGESMWIQEMPTDAEMERGISSLEAAEWKVDIVITHSLPSDIQELIFSDYEYETNSLTDFLYEIDSRLEFGLWFSGHYHRSMSCDDKHFLLYNDIIRLTEDGFVKVFPNWSRTEE